MSSKDAIVFSAPSSVRRERRRLPRHRLDLHERGSTITNDASSTAPNGLSAWRPKQGSSAWVPVAPIDEPPREWLLVRPAAASLDGMSPGWSPFQHMPIDALAHVLGYLHLWERHGAKMVCRRWYQGVWAAATCLQVRQYAGATLAQCLTTIRTHASFRLKALAVTKLTKEAAALIPRSVVLLRVTKGASEGVSMTHLTSLTSVLIENSDFMLDLKEHSSLKYVDVQLRCKRAPPPPLQHYLPESLVRLRYRTRDMSLCLQGFHHLTHLDTEWIELSGSWPPTLQHLTLRLIQQYSAFVPLAPSLDGLTALQHLTHFGLHTTRGIGMLSLNFLPPTVQSLSVVGVPFCDVPTTLELPATLIDLRHLSLSYATLLGASGNMGVDSSGAIEMHITSLTLKQAWPQWSMAQFPVLQNLSILSPSLTPSMAQRLPDTLQTLSAGFESMCDEHWAALPASLTSLSLVSTFSLAAVEWDRVLSFIPATITHLCLPSAFIGDHLDHVPSGVHHLDVSDCISIAPQQLALLPETVSHICIAHDLRAGVPYLRNAQTRVSVKKSPFDLAWDVLGARHTDSGHVRLVHRK